MANRDTIVVRGGGGITFLGALFLILLTLKLTGVITWSWWWVTAPLWGPVALFVGGLIIFLLVFIGVMIGMVLAAWLFKGLDKPKTKRPQPPFYK